MLSNKLINIACRFAALAERCGGTMLLGAAVLGVLSLGLALRLELRTDLLELLPDQHPGVVALRRVAGRQISSTNLVVLIESESREANRRFAEALRPGLERMIPTVFSEIQWRPEDEVPAFAHRWRWLYAPLPDLLAAERLLERLIARRRTPLLVDLEGDPEEELRELRRRLEQRLPPAADPTPYFEAREPGREAGGRWRLGIMLWRRGGGLATLDDRQTVDAVRALATRLGPRSFDPSLTVQYTGHIALALDEQDAVRDDLAVATTACVALVMLAIWSYFRRAALLLVIGAPAVLGVLMALALARLAIGYLNANTAFLISIILGNGINTPIVLLARYREERRAQDPTAALRAALSATLLPTLIAATAAALAYGSLLCTSLRGLSQFGIVGSAGMLLCWAAAVVLTPPLVLTLERRSSGGLMPAQGGWRRPFFLLEHLPRRARAALLLGLLAISAVPAARYLRDPIEYNFENLRTREGAAQRRWAIMYELGMGNVGAGYIARDGVLLVDRPEQAEPVARALWQAELQRGEGRVLESVRTLQMLLPTDQDAKLAVLARLRASIDQNEELASDEERRELRAWRPPEHLRRLGISDLPRRLREAFTEVDGTVGRLIGIDADPRRFVESDGRELIRLARAMEVEALGRRWVAASTSTVFAGMLEAILRDGPIVTAAAFMSVVLLMIVALGPRGAGPTLLTVLIGLTWLVALLGLFQVKLNFLNFVALPLTLGIGTEYAVNLWARARREGRGAVAGTGSAVALCSLTTIIGYSSLLLARSRALQSFGIIADLGEVTCLLAALLAVPVLTGRRGRD